MHAICGYSCRFAAACCHPDWRAPAIAQAAARRQSQTASPAISASTSAPNGSLAACTAVIDAKAETGRRLAGAYCIRGHELTEKRELDAALADLTRRSGATRPMPARSTIAAASTVQGRLRPRHRGLQRGDQARSEHGARLQQSRRRLASQGRPRPRHRGFQRGDPHRSGLCARLRQSRLCLLQAARLERAIEDYSAQIRIAAGRARLSSTAATPIATPNSSTARPPTTRR